MSGELLAIERVAGLLWNLARMRSEAPICSCTGTVYACLPRAHRRDVAMDTLSIEG